MKSYSALILGDTHVPFEDQRALRVVRAVGRALDPDVLVHLGDLIDAWQISTYDKDPARRTSLQEDIERAARLLNSFSRTFPRARKVLLEGNHEERLSRTIRRMTEQQREIAGLNVFQKAVTWENILRDAGVTDWSFVSTALQSTTTIIPRLVIKHGTKIRSRSAVTAYAEWERYGKSGISGHSHRLGEFLTSDLNGSHIWVECGCTCQLQPEYMTDPNWQQGCYVLTWTKHRFNFERVYIQDGVGIWRGREYRA